MDLLPIDHDHPHALAQSAGFSPTDQTLPWPQSKFPCFPIFCWSQSPALINQGVFPDRSVFPITPPLLFWLLSSLPDLITHPHPDQGRFPSALPLVAIMVMVVVAMTVMRRHSSRFRVGWRSSGHHRNRRRTRLGAALHRQHFDEVWSSAAVIFENIVKNTQDENFATDVNVNF